MGHTGRSEPQERRNTVKDRRFQFYASSRFALICGGAEIDVSIMSSFFLGHGKKVYRALHYPHSNVSA